MLVRMLMILAMGGLLGGEVCQGGDKKKEDPLQGTWTIVSVFDENGKKMPVKDLKDYQGPGAITTWVFDRDKGALVFRDGKKQEFVFQLFPAKKPRAIDLVWL